MKRIVIHITLFGSLFGMAQVPIMMSGSDEINPLAVNYSSIPDLGGTEIRSYGANFNFGLPIKESIVGFSLGYQNLDFSFNETTNLIDLSAFENMQVIRSSISFMKPIKDELRFVLSVGTSIMSNFGDGISSEDFVFNAIIGAMKKWGNEERNTTLLLGAFYGTQFGEPTLLPAISLSQKLNQHWSYSLGLPITGLNYKINEKNRLSLLASPQGIFGNNSNLQAVEGNRTITNTKLQFNGINTRLAYQFRFQKNLAFFTEGGFVPSAVLKILDDNNNEIIDLNPGSGAFINAGIRAVFTRPNSNRIKKENNED